MLTKLGLLFVITLVTRVRGFAFPSACGCYNNGLYDNTTGLCACPAGYAGTRCQISTQYSCGFGVHQAPIQDPTLFYDCATNTYINGASNQQPPGQGPFIGPVAIGMPTATSQLISIISNYAFGTLRMNTYNSTHVPSTTESYMLIYPVEMQTTISTDDVTAGVKRVGGVLSGSVYIRNYYKTDEFLSVNPDTNYVEWKTFTNEQPQTWYVTRMPDNDLYIHVVYNDEFQCLTTCTSGGAIFPCIASYNASGSCPAWNAMFYSNEHGRGGHFRVTDVHEMESIESYVLTGDDASCSTDFILVNVTRQSSSDGTGYTLQPGLTDYECLSLCIADSQCRAFMTTPYTLQQPQSTCRLLSQSAISSINQNGQKCSKRVNAVVKGTVYIMPYKFNKNVTTDSDPMTCFAPLYSDLGNGCEPVRLNNGMQLRGVAMPEIQFLHQNGISDCNVNPNLPVADAYTICDDDPTQSTRTCVLSLDLMQMQSDQGNTNNKTLIRFSHCYAPTIANYWTLVILDETIRAYIYSETAMSFLAVSETLELTMSPTPYLWQLINNVDYPNANSYTDIREDGAAFSIVDPLTRRSVVLQSGSDYNFVLSDVDTFFVSWKLKETAQEMMFSSYAITLPSSDAVVTYPTSRWYYCSGRCNTEDWCAAFVYAKTVGYSDTQSSICMLLKSVGNGAFTTQTVTKSGIKNPTLQMRNYNYGGNSWKLNSSEFTNDELHRLAGIHNWANDVTKQMPPFIGPVLLQNSNMDVVSANSLTIKMGIPVDWTSKTSYNGYYSGVMWNLFPTKQRSTYYFLDAMNPSSHLFASNTTNVGFRPSSSFAEFSVSAHQRWVVTQASKLFTKNEVFLPNIELTTNTSFVLLSTRFSGMFACVDAANNVILTWDISNCSVASMYDWNIKFSIQPKALLTFENNPDASLPALYPSATIPSVLFVRKSHCVDYIEPIAGHNINCSGYALPFSTTDFKLKVFTASSIYECNTACLVYLQDSFFEFVSGGSGTCYCYDGYKDIGGFRVMLFSNEFYVEEFFACATNIECSGNFTDIRVQGFSLHEDKVVLALDYYSKIHDNEATVFVEDTEAITTKLSNLALLIYPTMLKNATQSCVHVMFAPTCSLYTTTTSLTNQYMLQNSSSPTYLALDAFNDLTTTSTATDFSWDLIQVSETEFYVMHLETDKIVSVFFPMASTSNTVQTSLSPALLSVFYVYVVQANNALFEVNIATTQISRWTFSSQYTENSFSMSHFLLPEANVDCAQVCSISTSYSFNTQLFLKSDNTHVDFVIETSLIVPSPSSANPMFLNQITCVSLSCCIQNCLDSNCAALFYASSPANTCYLYSYYISCEQMSLDTQKAYCVTNNAPEKQKLYIRTAEELNDGVKLNVSTWDSFSYSVYNDGRYLITSYPQNNGVVKKAFCLGYYDPLNRKQFLKMLSTSGNEEGDFTMQLAGKSCTLFTLVPNTRDEIAFKYAGEYNSDGQTYSIISTSVQYYLYFQSYAISANSVQLPIIQGYQFIETSTAAFTCLNRYLYVYRQTSPFFFKVQYLEQVPFYGTNFISPEVQYAPDPVYYNVQQTNPSVFSYYVSTNSGHTWFYIYFSTTSTNTFPGYSYTSLTCPAMACDKDRYERCTGAFVVTGVPGNTNCRYDPDGKLNFMYNMMLQENVQLNQCLLYY